MMQDICIDYCESTICDGCKYKDASDEEREKAFYAEELSRFNEEQAKRFQELGLVYY